MRDKGGRTDTDAAAIRMHRIRKYCYKSKDARKFVRFQSQPRARK